MCFRGLEATCHENGLLLHLTKYIGNILCRLGMSSCKDISTPSSPTDKLALSDSDKFHDETLFCSIVGGLQYLIFTRPDISYAINKVS
jgi:hypothetical protein